MGDVDLVKLGALPVRHAVTGEKICNIESSLWDPDITDPKLVTSIHRSSAHAADLVFHTFTWFCKLMENCCESTAADQQQNLRRVHIALGRLDAADDLTFGILFFQTVELQSLWRDHTSVLFFLRRFGCQLCRWTAKEVSKLQDSFSANQVCLIGIGPESLGLKEFVDGNFFTGELYLDESKQSYKELGFKRSVSEKSIQMGGNQWLYPTTLCPSPSNVPAALGKKVRDVVTKANADGVQGNFSGDLLQSGGMLIVTKGGEKVLLHFVQDSPGDHISLETVAQTLGISANVTEGQRPQVTPM
ncbi:unnamed protein product [Ranitomeya imitator]|uniref:Prostamide/prostaglandin F synthase n=1 Tax=Ranitomeya imitator TaxID=111125 RepID=A0ABN9KZ98_9NEOB|nr:unnamed protein product [Ranitomeya imitator]